MLVTKYLHEEFKQYHYFSLKPLPPIVKLLPEDPQSTDILTVQQALETEYQAEIVAQKARSLGWVYIEVDATAEPRTLASLAANGSASVVLPIPLKNVTDPQTNASSMVANTLYYQVRLHDVGIYLLDATRTPLGNGPVEVELNKSGLSSFFDSSMQLHTFSHDPITYGSGTFYYDSKTGCPETQSYCGELCPDYIRYSPFGKWNVRVYDATAQGVDLSKLATLRFEFQIDFEKHSGFNPNIFGKDPMRYSQNFGRLCAKEAQHEIDALDASSVEEEVA